MSDEVTPLPAPEQLAWPPTVPPTGRLNTTPQATTHPGDHNAIATALGDIVTRLGGQRAAVVASHTITAPTGPGAAGAWIPTGLTVTWTADAARRYRVGWTINVQKVTNLGEVYVAIWRSGSQLPGGTIQYLPVNAFGCSAPIFELPQYTGAQTLTLQVFAASVGAVTTVSATYPATLWVEDIGLR